MSRRDRRVGGRGSEWRRPRLRRYGRPDGFLCMTSQPNPLESLVNETVALRYPVRSGTRTCSGMRSWNLSSTNPGGGSGRGGRVGRIHRGMIFVFGHAEAVERRRMGVVLCRSPDGRRQLAATLQTVGEEEEEEEEISASARSCLSTRLSHTDFPNLGTRNVIGRFCGKQRQTEVV